MILGNAIDLNATCKLESEDVEAILKMLQLNGGLYSIGFTNVYLNADDARKLASAIALNTTVERIYIYDNSLSREGMKFRFS